MDKSKIKVCVGLSGGVDSSVAAYLLKQEGYDVFAMFMQNWHDADSTLHGDCEWEEDRFVAEMVARKIGIPFYFADLSKQYRQRVVDYMFDEYAKGRTPNPDVLCNREIKFDAFLQVALKSGADFVATGHYCRKEEIPGQAGNDGVMAGSDRPSPVYRILEGTDPNKDQTYFLCQLSQEQLAKALFPIGHLTKPEVRRIAKEADLPSAEKKDSQGICFVGKVDLPTFLKQKLTSVEGDVVEVFDPYYATDALYQWQQEKLGSLLKEGQTLERTVHYAPEEKILTSDGKPLGESPFRADAVAALTDAELNHLSLPVTYQIAFETETYRSGKHHIKKTRYKPARGRSVLYHWPTQRPGHWRPFRACVRHCNRHGGQPRVRGRRPSPQGAQPFLPLCKAGRDSLDSHRPGHAARGDAPLPRSHQLPPALTKCHPPDAGEWPLYPV